MFFPLQQAKRSGGGLGRGKSFAPSPTKVGARGRGMGACFPLQQAKRSGGGLGRGKSFRPPLLQATRHGGGVWGWGQGEFTFAFSSRSSPTIPSPTARKCPPPDQGRG
ncbi:MAG UNVERIFIED_CONTAM: hypothetical protein LVT10_22220 [Anaerolineae bacterium]